MPNEQLALFIQAQVDGLKRIRSEIENSLPDSCKVEYVPMLSLKPGPHYNYPILDDLNEFISNMDKQVEILLGRG